MSRMFEIEGLSSEPFRSEWPTYVCDCGEIEGQCFESGSSVQCEECKSPGSIYVGYQRRIQL